MKMRDERVLKCETVHMIGDLFSKATGQKVQAYLNGDSTRVDVYCDNRMLISEESVPPMSFQGMVRSEHLLGARLDETAESLIFLEFSEFVLSHFCSFSIHSPFRTKIRRPVLY